MSSPQQGPRRGQRTRKATAKGRNYIDSLVSKAATRRIQNAQAQAQSTAVANTPVTNTTNRATSSQGDANGGARRSKRSQGRVDGKAPDGTSCNTGRSSKRRRVSGPGPSLEGFMIKLYAEIHHAATVRTMGQWERYWTQRLLRQPRTLRFFDLSAVSTRRPLRERLNKFESTDPKAKRVANLAKDDVNIDYAQRLTDLCDEPNLLLLTICAHSKSFRDAVARSDAESRAQGKPEWSDIYPRIKQCASSLELFARTHKFEWKDALFTFNDHFTDLLKIVYKDCRDVHGKDGFNFGIGQKDLREIHQIGAEDKHMVQHHWVLPPVDGEPAVWPSVKCTITQDVIRAGFVDGDLAIAGIPEEGDNLEINPASILPPNSKVTLQQFNIEQCVVLPDYPWPEETHKVVYEDGAVYEDPAFCGFPGNPCTACGAEEPEPAPVISINHDTDADGETDLDSADVAAPGNEQQQSSGRACKCTFADLCKRHNKPPQDSHHDILVELYTTKEKGRGVRALQTIRPGTYLGEYTGEIYAVQPAANKIAGSMQNHRYGVMTYHMNMDIERADDYAATGARRKGGSVKTTISRGQYRPQYTIDATHRGSWTRYINHSCAPNTAYVVVSLGQRTRVVVRARRRIAFAEELTVDYGRGYFDNLRMVCRCGEPRCRHKTVVDRASASGRDSESESGSGSGSGEAEEE
ncbi:uncharacterized protein Z519_02111 [Cladophialophora bantiana CBS 173.52]|uniref:SET domain-containing protein n=1 Tax=Cladophialophora bantiana (strain ATCC 10958 / CBS 173.52 / CDC B-1940 / NIH 8579) TaxID=1442370 RepID=A0A0D2I0L3_CLAB1|nr:uncharacterized protein Z519_02111 [Cladophialophora bantiana CBS 173.52]KIW96720.1 hypothetical protein Z519_02111 [Cladophialophora bantiana CBS 173.52]